MAETFDWVEPSPLWLQGGAGMNRRGFFRPALHEFTTDKFMEDFLASAAAASPKSFRDSLARPAAGRDALKFFQPVHGNFYLTSASLCCRVAGFPDREVRPGEGESVFFVLRRRVGGVEFAWDASEAGRGWMSVAKPETIPDGEERLPLFQTKTGAGRQIFFGYIPVASQETYAAPPSAELPAGRQEDPRIQELDGRFIGPLANPFVFGPPLKPAPEPTARRVSVYLLLELWEYLDLYLPEVAAALRDGSTTGLTGASRALADYMGSNRATFKDTTLTLAAALAQVAAKESQLNEPGDADVAALGFTADYNLDEHPLTGLDDKDTDDDFRGRVEAALAEAPETKPDPVAQPKISTQAGDRYVLRYVYCRCRCEPPRLYVSRPTRSFELAPFFDPDAPGRNIRVGLPVDVSLAGLRKFKKNVGFIISKELNRKLEGVAGKEKDILDNNASVSDGGIDVGFICSFSLPIITLCAFILLMIIVILLNIVFWWIPLLKICFPIPLAAKK
ncbi:MAG TPA: hypothetical protein VF668_02010 [Pyrinomonadaceae bacterium]|jgi:hypothetical protein